MFGPKRDRLRARLDLLRERNKATKAIPLSLRNGDGCLESTTSPRGLELRTGVSEEHDFFRVVSGTGREISNEHFGLQACFPPPDKHKAQPRARTPWKRTSYIMALEATRLPSNALLFGATARECAPQGKYCVELGVARTPPCPLPISSSMRHDLPESHVQAIVSFVSFDERRACNTPGHSRKGIGPATQAPRGSLLQSTYTPRGSV